jgi:hypothetical protein
MGRYSDWLGMWIEPVTAQLMTTFSCFMDMIFSPFSL